jgi:hypothetical protein
MADWALWALVQLGLIERSELENVQIRWCDLQGDTIGIVPDRNLIYLDHSYNPTSSQYDPQNQGLVGLGALLVHEMEHVRQYRRMGTDAFKCEYAETFKGCLGCQDKRHRLERPAFERQEVAIGVLSRELRSEFCGPFAVEETCSLPSGSKFWGEPCSCRFGAIRHQGLVGW